MHGGPDHDGDSLSKEMFCLRGKKKKRKKKGGELHTWARGIMARAWRGMWGVEDSTSGFVCFGV